MAFSGRHVSLEGLTYLRCAQGNSLHGPEFDSDVERRRDASRALELDASAIAINDGRSRSRWRLVDDLAGEFGDTRERRDKWDVNCRQTLTGGESGVRPSSKEYLPSFTAGSRGPFAAGRMRQERRG